MVLVGSWLRINGSDVFLPVILPKKLRGCQLGGDDYEASKIHMFRKTTSGSLK